ncbi:MAG: DUF3592 domain-containing protein [Acidobacteriota bacterium]|nr:DUF3592 domain-containing protein [Acidobacteriota bacterium]MDH3529461.1 DUF3592 domain-containing protein [Acidobacteriota bacterium]
MSFFTFLRRKRKPETAEQRRERLLQRGRITDGVIIDSEISVDGDEIVQYSYSVHGAEFESSEQLTDEQKLDPVKYAPGASVSVRFDPNNHGNSIIV